jgi:hypothetical protein
VTHLLVMAIALSVSALILGTAGDQLHRRGISLSATFAAATGIALVAQLALILRWPVPAWLPWMAIAGMGAGTVLSYAIVSQLFPKSASGRANGALNLLHIGSAFVVQTGFGIIVQLWPGHAGQYPAVAYQTALAINLALQCAALVWFLRPQRQAVMTLLRAHPIHEMARSLGLLPSSVVPYLYARQSWSVHGEQARQHARTWRSIALSAFTVLMMISSSLAMMLGGGSLAGRHTLPGSQFAIPDAPAQSPQMAFAKHTPHWPKRKPKRE